MGGMEVHIQELLDSGSEHISFCRKEQNRDVSQCCQFTFISTGSQEAMLSGSLNIFFPFYFGCNRQYIFFVNVISQMENAGTRKTSARCIQLVAFEGKRVQAFSFPQTC